MNLQDLCERIVRDATPTTDSGATCFVPRYQIDQLREALSAVPQPPAEAQRCTCPSAPVGVEGTWLWGKLMDWCREQRIAPATQDKLFAIAGEAHRLNALAQQPA